MEPDGHHLRSRQVDFEKNVSSKTILGHKVGASREKPQYIEGTDGGAKAAQKPGASSIGWVRPGDARHVRPTAANRRMMMLDKTAKKPAAKKAAPKAAAAKKTESAPRTDGIHKPVTPSADLAAIVGEGAMPRSQIVSKMWEYIKSNKLQDEKDKRQINGDAKLKKIFGKDKVSMFEMNKHISAHVK